MAKMTKEQAGEKCDMLILIIAIFLIVAIITGMAYLIDDSSYESRVKRCVGNGGQYTWTLDDNGEKEFKHCYTPEEWKIHLEGKDIKESFY